MGNQERVVMDFLFAILNWDDWGFLVDGDAKRS